MLKVSGQWVSPVEVEAALSAHPSVLEAAVVGREDADGLIKPHAFVVLNAGEQPSPELAEALKQHVKTTLTPAQISALDRVRRRATQDRDRQSAALCAAQSARRRGWRVRRRANARARRGIVRMPADG